MSADTWDVVVSVVVAVIAFAASAATVYAKLMSLDTKVRGMQEQLSMLLVADRSRLCEVHKASLEMVNRRLDKFDERWRKLEMKGA